MNKLFLLFFLGCLSSYSSHVSYPHTQSQQVIYVSLEFDSQISMYMLPDVLKPIKVPEIPIKNYNYGQRRDVKKCLLK